MSSNRNVTVKGFELGLDMLSGGIDALFVNQSTIVVGGVAYTKKELAAKLSDAVTPYKERRAARTLFNQKHLAVVEGYAAARKLARAVKIAALALLGEDNPELAKLGFKPRKTPKPPTGDELALRAARARRTREARGTLGSRQREKVHGAEIDQVTVGDPATPASPTPDANRKAV